VVGFSLSGQVELSPDHPYELPYIESLFFYIPFLMSFTPGTAFFLKGEQCHYSYHSQDAHLLVQPLPLLPSMSYRVQCPHLVQMSQFIQSPNGISVGDVPRRKWRVRFRCFGVYLSPLDL